MLPQRRIFNFLRIPVPVLMGLLSLLAVSGTPVSEQMENRIRDTRTRAFASPGGAAKNIILVLVDEKSLAWAKETSGLTWPWPRETWALVADFCRIQGAKSVAFDLSFSKPSAYGAMDDFRLADALEAFPGAVLPVPFANGGTPGHWPEEAPKREATHLPAVPAGRNHLPAGTLLRKAPRLGSVLKRPDRDGVYRRMPAAVLLDEKPLPALALAGLSPLPDAARLPVDDAGLLRLAFRGTPWATVSISDVIAARLSGKKADAVFSGHDRFKDAHVIVGFATRHPREVMPTPLGFMGTSFLHATLLDNALTDAFIRPAVCWQSLFLFLLLSAAAVFGIKRTPTYKNGLLLSALLLPVPFLLSVLFHLAGRELLVIPMTTGLLFTLAAGLLFVFFTEGRARRTIKRRFAGILHPEGIRKLAAQPDLLERLPENREVTLFHACLDAFEPRTRSLDEERRTALLAGYRKTVTEILLSEGALLLPLEYHHISAIWNLPARTDDHAKRAVCAAIRCHDALVDLAGPLQADPPLRMRIGIHTEAALVDATGKGCEPLAARARHLAGVAASLESPTLMANKTADRLPPDLAFRKLGQIRTTEGNLPVYSPCHSFETAAILEKFREALIHFEGGSFYLARLGFSRICESDPTAAAYLARMKQAGTDEAFMSVWSPRDPDPAG